MQIVGFNSTRKNQRQAIIPRRANLHEILGFAGDAQHIFFRHRDRPTGDMADNVGLDFVDDLKSCHLADARSRDAAGMDFHLDTAHFGPFHIALRFAVGQQAVIVKDELDQLNAERLDLVKIFFCQPRDQ